MTAWPPITRKHNLVGAAARLSCSKSDTPSVVLRQPFHVPDVLHWLENVPHVGEELWIEWLLNPFCPVANVVRVRAAGNGRGDVGVGTRELQREFGDINSPLRTMLGGSARGGLYGLRFLEPRRQRRVGQQTRAERTGVQDADAFRFEIGNRLVGEARVLERVLIVVQHAVHVGPIADEPEDFLRITAEADEAHLALPLNLPERGQGLIDDLPHVHELNVVTEEDVEVIGTEPMQADIDAFGHAPRGEIEVRQIIAAQFGAEGETVARRVAQGNAEEHFAHPAPVKRRGVDEVEPAIERDADAAQRLVETDLAELLPERRRAEAEDRELESGTTKGARFHGSGRKTPKTKLQLPEKLQAPNRKDLNGPSAGTMQSTDGERGRLDRSRRRPADGPAALGPTNQRTKW